VALKTAGVGQAPFGDHVVFLRPSRLVHRMRRTNPSILVTTDMDATLSLARFVFVLPDSTSHRLDIAMAAASGRYVHLIAVGSGRPRFRFGAL
jgi:hypothetical protein